jgi:hypothetical protein
LLGKLEQKPELGCLVALASQVGHTNVALIPGSPPQCSHQDDPSCSGWVGEVVARTKKDRHPNNARPRSNLIKPYFFFQWGYPSLCIEEMHTAFLYFIYSTKDWQEALQRSYKWKPPTKGIKAPPN